MLSSFATRPMTDVMAAGLFRAHDVASPAPNMTNYTDNNSDYEERRNGYPEDRKVHESVQPQKANGIVSLNSPRNGVNGDHTDNVTNGHDIPASPVPVLSDTSLPPAELEPVMVPFEYIRSLPSKGVRDLLINGLNIWTDVPSDVLPSISSIIADVHNLSLMFDDIQDDSPLRRARPSTHCVFGVPQTINSATYQVVDVIARTRSLNDKNSLDAVIDEMKNLLIGQSHDLLWVNLLSVPTIDEYLRMVDGKTGGLFRMISRFLIAQSSLPDKPTTLDRLMTLLGRHFQIRDDYMNLVMDQYTQTKGFCEDLDEGKYSFILIHALRTAPTRLKTLLENMLIQRRTAGKAPPGHKEFILALFHETGSLEYTAKALEALHADLEDEIRAIEGSTGRPNPVLWHLLDALRV